MPRSAAVIGGGVAGLVAALELAQRGDRVVVFELSDHVGGAVSRASLSGAVVDIGAESFAITRPETSALIDELGLTASVIAPRRSDARLLLADGLFAMPHAMLGIPTDLSAPDTVAVLGEAAAARARELDALPIGAIEANITLGALVRARMGDAVVDRILLPVVGGVHASDPDLVEADAVVPGILRALAEAGSLAGAAARLRSASGVPGAAVAGLTGGMSTLITALLERVRSLGVRVALQTSVIGVEQRDSTWSVTLDDGAKESFDELVVAIDAPAAARLLHWLPSVADPLSAIPSGDVAVVALVVDEPALDADPVGSGLLIARDLRESGLHAKAMTHASAKWQWVRDSYPQGRHLVRLSYGKDGRVDESMDNLPDIAARDLAAILGLASVSVVESQVIRWDASLVQPRPGHRARVQAVREAATAISNLAVVGGGLGGNGLAGTIALARTVRSQLQD